MARARSTASLFARWRSRFFPAHRRDPRHELGRRGEVHACALLKKTGYKILYRNFRPRGGGEVDVVCRHGDILVFVEVKTRSSAAFGRPLEAVDAEKRWLVSQGAIAWLRLLKNPEIVFRFDVAEVVRTPAGRLEVNVVQDAFTLPEPLFF